MKLIFTNEISCYYTDEFEKVEGPLQNVTIVEVLRALMKKKNNKTASPSKVTSDLIKMTEEVSVNQLRKIFEQIILNEKCSKEWEDSDTEVVYKGKGDALDCGYYRGIRLLEHSMKVWKKVLEARLREIITINQNQLGFSPGKNTIDGLFVLRQLQEKYGGMKKELHLIFVDLEKSFDRVPKREIKWALRKQNVPERMVQLIMALYVNTNSRVKTFTGTSKEFEIKVGVPQVSVFYSGNGGSHERMYKRCSLGNVVCSRSGAHGSIRG